MFEPIELKDSSRNQRNQHIYEDVELDKTKLEQQRNGTTRKGKTKCKSKHNSELWVPRQVFFANCQADVSSFAHYQ